MTLPAIMPALFGLFADYPELVSVTEGEKLDVDDKVDVSTPCVEEGVEVDTVRDAMVGTISRLKSPAAVEFGPQCCPCVWSPFCLFP